MADCLLCAGSHADEVEACPQLRRGQTIAGKYTLGPLLGVGGIAAVYAARHAVLGRDVALKILHQRFATDRELSSRFVREARETAALGHPAFVEVYDAGTSEDGCAFIEMDRLNGTDLFTVRREQGPLAIERVVGITLVVLDALGAMHARGVIHRDMKSANIFLDQGPAGEQIKILDLGFAKANDELQLTQKDHMLGTPFYISPEQYLDPSAVDARADVFSLGVVMFETLTGTWPYEWTDKRDLLRKVMKGELERHPATRRPEIPAWLDDVVANSLAHRREDRFGSAAEMRAAIERAGQAPDDKPGLLRRLFGR